MRSEEEIRKAARSVIENNLTYGKPPTIYNSSIVSEAVEELLTLRRRLDRDSLAAVILHEELKNQPNAFKVADAIIKYLTEG